jgi:hypothetical protein
VAKKIKVVFELDPQDVKELIEFGSKGPDTISREELKELVKTGTIRASDYLEDDEVEAFFGIFRKLAKAVSKAGKEVVGKVREYTPVVREKVTDVTRDVLTDTVVVETGTEVVQIISSGSVEEPPPDLPKE